MTLSNFLPSFALSWALTSLIVSMWAEKRGLRIWAAAIFNFLVLLLLTCVIPLVIPDLLDIQYNEMTRESAFGLYLLELVSWTVFVLPQILITIHELRRSR